MMIWIEAKGPTSQQTKLPRWPSLRMCSEWLCRPRKKYVIKTIMNKTIHLRLGNDTRIAQACLIGKNINTKRVIVVGQRIHHKKLK